METQLKRDYYEILGVARAATEQEIKSAFLKLAAEYQAAGKPANIDAVERFRVIARAFRVLSDAELRRRYDQLGENGIVQPFSSGYDLEKWPLTDPEITDMQGLADMIALFYGV